MFNRIFALIASLLFSFSGWAVQLQTGDVLLLELSCYSCQRIASETGSRFSHSGVVIKDLEKGELVVAEALSSVRLVEVDEFLARSAKGASVKVMRSKDISEKLDQDLREDLYLSFIRDYQGLPFDRLYIWDRVDDQGRPMLYCSEFIAKYLNPFLELTLEPEPLDFSQNWDYWMRYYQGDVPQGELGNSPASFETAPGWFEVGEIYPSSGLL